MSSIFLYPLVKFIRTKKSCLLAKGDIKSYVASAPPYIDASWVYRNGKVIELRVRHLGQDLLLARVAERTVEGEHQRRGCHAVVVGRDADVVCPDDARALDRSEARRAGGLPWREGLGGHQGDEKGQVQ